MRLREILNSNRVLFTLLVATFLSSCYKNDDKLPEKIYVSGQVVDSPSNKGLSGVRIKVSRSANFAASDELHAYTDSAGSYAFSFKPYRGSYYDVHFEKTGYEEVNDKPLYPVQPSFEFYIKLYKK